MFRISNLLHLVRQHHNGIYKCDFSTPCVQENVLLVFNIQRGEVRFGIVKQPIQLHGTFIGRQLSYINIIVLSRHEFPAEVGLVVLEVFLYGVKEVEPRVVVLFLLNTQIDAFVLVGGVQRRETDAV